MSLNNLGNRLSDLGRREEALAATQEAVEILKPFFLQQPLAFSSWLAIMLRNYARNAEEAGQEPDSTLVQPILDVFEAMQAQSPSEGTSNP